ncbi:hypothetical protein [Methylobacterium frigidaeris]|uniref:Uncharacterized protein n=1 Tax=Methylobacterium frigidaeris TaxID=2038277 RepID=A0AA37M381_9HYPH|nr:hypothetical protein [Methylobacterium frigidaeris]PIK69089.1 hypothetical protein CS379_31595 [Methylobacterium frigidaeris]GJD61117.1 hypothetical protein MPEAHAMD_1257 [Methylobacterium frigidaeris]
MLGSDTHGIQRPPGVGSAAMLDRVPLPLRALLDRIEHRIVDLAEGAEVRETMHALRSALSDICALTETNPKILRTVERLLSAGERLAQVEARPLRSLASARGAATRAFKALTAALVDTRPSRIAVSLGRGW